MKYLPVCLVKTSDMAQRSQLRFTCTSSAPVFQYHEFHEIRRINRIILVSFFTLITFFHQNLGYLLPGWRLFKLRLIKSFLQNIQQYWNFIVETQTARFKRFWKDERNILRKRWRTSFFHLKCNNFVSVLFKKWLLQSQPKTFKDC